MICLLTARHSQAFVNGFLHDSFVLTKQMINTSFFLDAQFTYLVVAFILFGTSDSHQPWNSARTCAFQGQRVDDSHQFNPFSPRTSSAFRFVPI
jgi:hypothetical protein